MFEATPLGGVLEMLSDVLIAAVVLIVAGISLGFFVGGVALGYKLVMLLAGF